MSSSGPRPNLTASLASVDTTLACALHTGPSPLTVSLAGQDPVEATLEVVLTNEGTAPLEIASLALTLPVGTEAVDLASTSAGIGCSVSYASRWSVSPPEATTSGSAVWRVLPAGGGTETLDAGAALVVELSGIPVNEAVGTSLLTVDEELAGEVRSTVFALPKYPYGFYFDGLTAAVWDTDEERYVPVAQVANGTRVTLLWNGSVTEPSAYTVRYATAGGQAVEIATSAGEWTAPEGIAADTVFVVEVRTSDDGESLSCTQTTRVAVAKPDVTARSLSVGGALAAGNASVPGAVTAAAAVTGAASLSGELDALSAATLQGKLSVSGDASLAAATVAGLLQAKAGAALTRAPNAIIGISSDASAYLAPDTDGWLVVSVVPPSDSTAVAAAMVTLSAGDRSMSQVGGNLCIWAEKSGDKTSVRMWKNAASLTFPVRKGERVTIAVEQHPENEVRPTVTFLWVPLGASRTAVVKM